MWCIFHAEYTFLYHSFSVLELMLVKLIMQNISFIMLQAGSDLSPYMTGRESSLWGILLMAGYLG
jgi:hypothetical protein